MPSSAQWAAIDSLDVLGNRRRHDLTNSAIYKCALLHARGR